MPSAKARASKAAIAARVAAYNASVAAMEEDAKVNAGVNAMNLKVDVQNASVKNAISAIPLQPTLPSMLNLNTSPNLNRALSVGAVLPQVSMNATGSDEENVPIPSNKPGPDDGIEANARLTASPYSPLIGGKEKDLRAFEIERQRAKRAGELAKRKAKKAKEAIIAAVHGQAPNRGLAESGVGLGQSISRKKPSKGIDEDVEEAKLPIIRKGGFGLSSISVGGRSGGAPNSAGAAAMEVSLSDLIVPSHRKARKALDDDFEFIPHVRSVIILDDLDAKEMDVDEPWEHIDDEVEFEGPVGSPKETGFSYASVLSGGNAQH